MSTQLTDSGSSIPTSEDASVAALGLGPTDPLEHGRAVADDSTPPVFKLVLTGGPCAGKTSALKKMSEYFPQRGFCVFTVPEAATTMFTNGMKLDAIRTPRPRFAFQWSILSLQMAMEDAFERCARASGKPSILLCDRGLMDGSVYMPPDEWARLIESNHLDEIELRDGRYDAIFHLVTAACGAEEHYSLENNEARSESVDQARDVELRTEAVWRGHPRHMIFDNSTDFEAKLERITAAASRLVGLPSPPRKQGKFILAQEPPQLPEWPVQAEEFEAEKIFLRRVDPAEGGVGAGLASTEDDAPVVCISKESFIEKRGKNGSFLYEITTIASNDNGTVSEVTRRLTPEVYSKLERERADPARPIVRQRRLSFLWERQTFELHMDAAPAHGTSVLHRRSEGGKLSLPAFLVLDE